MKTVVLLSLSLTVALGVPVLPPGVRAENQSPLLGDLVPVQGHVVVENPAPQIGLGRKGTPVEMKLKESVDEEKPEVKAEPGAKLEPEVKVEKTEPEVEEELQAQPEFKVASEVKEEESNMVEEEVKAEAEELEPDFKVESEVKVEPEEEPEELPDVPADMMTEERLLEAEEGHEPMNEPVMELEPLEEDDEEEETHKELSDEDMSLRREDYVAELLPEEDEEEEEDKVEEEEEVLRKRNSVLDEQPFMELEPEMTDEAAPNQAVMSGGAELDEEPSLEQQMMPLSENNPLDEEAQMEMFVGEEQFPDPLGEEPAEEDEGLQLDARQQALMGEANGQGERYCSGKLIEGKCYQFFKASKTYDDAELFCQNQSPGGHLASIASRSIHRDVMNLMLMQNGGYTRTWVGGRRDVNSNRFFWLDGSKWTYDDWLPGEPNDTAGVEDCVEVLALGNGLFNDYTCWTPQPFICSYPYQ
ncbi:FK506-binding protein 5 [Kryptolebias marmoratus]|uniref:FK506-binding protein 5-like n=1 Tax=Kryptolebias marmoratus TaxID=37003 RepID=A0A3Q2ZBE3_KRYMA|nr:FK506-binding protein 5 [Kryptolebias marmoratus]